MGSGIFSHSQRNKGGAGRRREERSDESDARNGDEEGRDDRRFHCEGSGRGERLAWEERAARVELRGPATAPRITCERVTVRLVRGAFSFSFGEAASSTPSARGVTERSIAGRLWVTPFLRQG